MATPISDPATLVALLQKCSQVTNYASDVVHRIGARRNAFLTQNLGDAVQQLDLILRVIEEEDTGNPKNNGRQTLLRRFFSRNNQANGESASDKDFEAPTFDVSHQGFQGNSSSVALPELLSFLSFGRKTGVLWVDTVEENFLLGITDGMLMHGSSDRTPEGLRLGEILVGFGYLTRRQLDRFISTQSGEGEGITGETLLDSGMITPEELQRALVHQVQQLFYRVVHTEPAIFRFRESFEIPHAYQVRLNINALLLSSAQAQDEEVNPEVRTEEVQKDWNSWTEKLSKQISKAPEQTEAAPVTAKNTSIPEGFVAQPAEPDSEPTQQSEVEPSQSLESTDDSISSKPETAGTEQEEANADAQVESSDPATEESKPEVSESNPESAQSAPEETHPTVDSSCEEISSEASANEDESLASETDSPSKSKEQGTKGTTNSKKTGTEKGSKSGAKGPSGTSNKKNIKGSQGNQQNSRKRGKRRHRRAG